METLKAKKIILETEEVTACDSLKDIARKNRKKCKNKSPNLGDLHRLELNDKKKTTFFSSNFNKLEKRAEKLKENYPNLKLT